MAGYNDLTAEERKVYLRLSKEEKIAFLKDKEKEKISSRVPKEDELVVDLDFGREVSEKEAVELLPEKSEPEEFPEQTRVDRKQEEEKREEEESPKYSFGNLFLSDNGLIDKMFYDEHRIESDEKEAQKAREDHKYLYINTIWDATYSAHKIFKPLYEAYVSCVRVMKGYKNVVVKYGLTILNTEVKSVVYKNGEYFTEDAEEFLESLRKIRFTGGSFDGKEDFNEALEQGIRAVVNASEKYANRGIIFFTDSVPENLCPNFKDIEGCPGDKKLRFAFGYAYDNKYTIQCNIGDAQGMETENIRNQGPEIMSMKKLFEIGAEEQLTKMIHKIMEKASVEG